MSAAESATSALEQAHQVLGVPLSQPASTTNSQSGQHPDDIAAAALTAKQQRLQARQVEQEEQEQAMPLPPLPNHAEVLRLIDECKHHNDEIELHLPVKGLLFIPKPVRQLRRLRVLNLRGNQISMLPTELCEALCELEILNLSYNRLRYLPENVSSMTHLRVLLVEHNELEGLPDGVCRLPLLQQLHLHNNRLEEISPAVVRLQQLKVLTLNSNKLTEVPRQLTKLRYLSHLNLSNNPMEYEALPDSLFRLNEMHSLLRSKRQRLVAIRRANNIRASLRKQLLNSEVYGYGDKAPPAPSVEAARDRDDGRSLAEGSLQGSASVESDLGDSIY